MKGPTTLGISQLSLSVGNLAGTLEFFDTLGFHRLSEMEGRTPDHAMILTDGSAVVSLWQIPGDARPFDRRHNVGLNHVSIRVATMEQLQSLYEEVQRVGGVTVEHPPRDLEGTNFVRAVVHEPSGIPVELTFVRE